MIPRSASILTAARIRSFFRLRSSFFPGIMNRIHEPTSSVSVCAPHNSPNAGCFGLNDGVRPMSHGILFHPDLIRGTSLGQEIKHYSFFSYASNEALHLSDDEKKIFQDCLDKVQQELSRPIDKHSKRLIARNIELLLDYCMRFYERQFVTRSKAQ